MLDLKSFNLVEEFQRTPRFVREPFAEIAPRGAEWINKGRIPAQGYGFLAGPSGVGKSFLALEWSLRISAGLPVMGQRTRRVGVIYVASEGANGVRKRVAAWRQTNPGADCAFEMIGQAPDLRDVEQVEDLIAELRLAADDLARRGIPLGLIVIDTLAASMPGGNENDGADMSALLTNVQRIALAIGGFVLVVSHTGKDEARGLRGWSGQFAGADVVIMLTRAEGAGLPTGIVKKQKDGEDGERFAFTLERVVIGQDEDGEISSAVVRYEAVPDLKNRSSRPLNSDEEMVMRAVRLCTDAEQVVDVSGPGVPPGSKGVLRASVKAKLVEIGFTDTDEKPETVKRRINRNISKLIARNLLRGTEIAVWLL